MQTFCAYHLNIWMLRSWRCTVLGRHPPSYRSRTYIWVCWNIYRESQCPDSNRFSTMAGICAECRWQRKEAWWRVGQHAHQDWNHDPEFGSLSQRRDQELLNILRYPEFRVGGMQSATIVQTLQSASCATRVAAPATEAILPGNCCGWVIFMEAGGDIQKLESVIRDCLEVLREIMRNPRWKNRFDFVARRQCSCNFR